MAGADTTWRRAPRFMKRAALPASIDNGSPSLHAENVNAAVPDQGSSPRELLEELLEEISTVAIRLRHPGTEPGQTQDLPAAVQAVLSILDRQGSLSVPAIARLKSTSRQNIQIIINRLKKAGLVDLSSNPAHKTSELVSLTESGRARLTKAEDKLGRSLDALAQQFTADELHSCLSSIHKLRRAFRAGKGDAESAPKRKRGVLPQRQSAAALAAKEEPLPDELPVNLL